MPAAVYRMTLLRKRQGYFQNESRDTARKVEESYFRMK